MEFQVARFKAYEGLGFPDFQLAAYAIGLAGLR